MWRLAVFSREVHRLGGSIAGKLYAEVGPSAAGCVCVWSEKKNKAEKSLIVTKSSIPASKETGWKVKVKILKESFRVGVC